MSRIARRLGVLLLPIAFAAAAAPAVSPQLYQDLHWRLVGPFRGGWATIGAGVPDQTDTYYVGTAGGGVWRTRNAGRTWQPLNDHDPFTAVGALAIADSNPNILYVGTGQIEPRYDIAGGNGVYKSTDGGEHWQPAGLEATQTIGAIHVDPRDANTVVVAALGHWFGPNPERGLFRSTDGGASWQQTLKIDDTTGAVDVEADPLNPDVLYAASWQARNWPWLSYFTPVTGPGSALWKSTDNGLTWSKLGGSGWPGNDATVSLGRMSLAVTHVKAPAPAAAASSATPPSATPGGAGSTRLYVTVDSEDNGGLWRSDDDGASWQRVNGDGDAFASWYSSRLRVAPDDPDTVYAVGQSIRVSHDAGKTFTVLHGAPGGDDFHSFWINPKHPEHWLGASDQGATVSGDGGKTWSSWYNQPTGQFYHLATDNRFPYWIYSGQQDSGTVAVASRTDYGLIGARDWHPVGGDERDDMVPDFNNPDIVYGSGLGGHVSRYDARTGQVANISPFPVSSYGKDPRTVKYRYGWVQPLAVSPAGSHALYSGAQLLFRSDDKGQTWKIISGDLTGQQDKAPRCDGDVAIADARACGFGVLATIAPSPLDANEIWTGSDSGVVSVTHDGGAHWSDVTPKGLPAWAKVASIEVSPLEPGVAYIAADNRRQDDSAPHAWRTADGGRTWKDVSRGLPADHAVLVVRTDTQRRGLLFAGTDAGVAVSFDDGAHWQSLQLDLPTAIVNDLLVHGDDLIAATQGRSLWVLDNIAPLRQLTPASSGRSLALFTPAEALRWRVNNNRDTPLPAEEPFALNPAGGAAIDYWIGSRTSGPVSLEIFDSQRQRVRLFRSDEPAQSVAAERYFAEDWLRPAPRLQATPGMHRFIWNLRGPQPRAASYDYSIAAVHGLDTPTTPAGAFVPPGRYEVVLTAGGQTARALLIVKPDPRVAVSDADFAAQYRLSQAVIATLAQCWQGFAETQAVGKQLDAAAAHLATATEPERQSLAEAVKTLRQSLQPPKPKHADDPLDLGTLSGRLASLESDIEGADGAPTAGQLQLQQALAAAVGKELDRWHALRDRELPALNLRLTAAGEAAVSVPPLSQLSPEPAEGGKDLP